MFFIVLHNRGDNKDNPSAKRFSEAFTSAMCNNYLRPSKQANYIDDLGSFLLGAKNISDASTDVTERSPGVRYGTEDKIYKVADDMEQYLKLLVLSKIVNYIGGYVVRKLKTKVVTIVFAL